MLSLVFSVLYGLQLFKEPGTDFGIYYAGAISTDPTFPLYEGFFETKGPLFYAFIKIINFLVPYSIEGASLTLMLVGFIWFCAIYLAVKLLDLSLEYSVLILFIGISVFIMQPTNGSINVFMCSFFIISISFAIRYSRQGNFINLAFSLIAAIMAGLTKLDGFIVIIISICIIIVSKRKTSINHLFLGVMISTMTVFFSLKLLQKILFFSLDDYLQLSFIDVFQKVWNPNTNGSAKNFLIRDYTSAGILFASGVFFIVLTAYFYSKPKDFDLKLVKILVLFGIFSYLILASDKNYHLFIIYPPLIVSILILLQYITDKRLISSYLILSGSVALSVMLNLVTIDKCAIFDVSSCSNRFKLLDETTKNQGSRDSIYFLNQGWPYIYAQVKPKVNFTATWDGWDDDSYYSVLKTQSDLLKDQILWVDLNELTANSLGQNEFISRYFPGREVTRRIEGTTFVGLSKK